MLNGFLKKFLFQHWNNDMYILICVELRRESLIAFSKNALRWKMWFMGGGVLVLGDGCGMLGVGCGMRGSGYGLGVLRFEFEVLFLGCLVSVVIGLLCKSL